MPTEAVTHCCTEQEESLTGLFLGQTLHSREETPERGFQGGFMYLIVGATLGIG